jgi:hypothetical protein
MLNENNENEILLDDNHDENYENDDDIQFEKLENLASLRDNGEITEEEFEKRKREILGIE